MVEILANFGRKTTFVENFFKSFFRYFSNRKDPESLGFIAPLAEKLSSPPVFGPRIVTASLRAPHAHFESFTKFVILWGICVVFGFFVKNGLR